MKNLKLMLILLLVPALLITSCKDEYTEKDALADMQSINVVVTVLDASSNNAPLAGAVIKVVVKDSVIVSKTTNSNGIAVFSDVAIGDESVVMVSKDNFTSVLSEINTTPDSYRQNQVTDVVYLYSTESAKVATFRGRLTLQSDVTDRDREPAVGVLVKAFNQSMDGMGNQVFTAVTDNDGKYVIAVPVSSNGDYIQITYPEIVADQKVALQKDNKIVVSTRQVLYKSDVSPQMIIPSLPSVYATIADPVANVGSGFTLGAKANRVPLSSGLAFQLIDGGSGYSGGTTVSDYQLSFSPDKNGNVAKLQVDITNGRITNIDYIIDNGATYDVAPTLNLSALAPTKQATIGLYFQTTYKIYIASKGSNYVQFPVVNVETNKYISGTKVKVFDQNVNDWSNDLIGYNSLLNNYSSIVAGKIVNDGANADTLITSSSYMASAPVFNTIDYSSKKAIIYVDTYDINSDSTLSNITIDDFGFGFDPSNPPAVTLTTVAGYGNGASAKAVVNTYTELADIILANPGKGYVRNVNDFRKDGSTGDDYEYPTYPSTGFNGVRPGDVQVQDVYYGTGYIELNKNTGKK